MRIKEILSQSRRDFIALYECDHCGKIVEGVGYDDKNFHDNVVPTMKCPGCGEIAKASYRALSTKYPDGFQI